MIGVGEKFPEFEMNGVIGNGGNADLPDHDFCTVNSWGLTDWSIIYFYPKDFTFICPTEIVAMDKLMNETTDIIGISGDNEYCKFAWRTEVEHSDLYAVEHVLAADCGLKLASELGIVNEEEGVCYRATYILDPEGIIRHVSVNELDTGRNAEEVRRTLKALKAGGLTGCAWEEGQEFADA